MKISIIGVGRVGSTVAHQIVVQGLADELVLVSRNINRARGEALDLRHAAALTSGRVEVRGGEAGDTRDSDVVIVTACRAQRGESPPPRNRLEMAEVNTSLYLELIPTLAELSPEAILVVVSNPVDILTSVALQCSGFPAQRVIGSGTLIDSARFRSRLSEHFGVHPDDIRAYILGEHGDSQFPVLSATQVAGWNIASDPVVAEFFAETVDSGVRVLEAKGYTNFGVAGAVTLIVKSIVRNTRNTMPLSTDVAGFYGIEDVCLSLPVVVGREGIHRRLPLQLSESEQASLKRSADRLKEILAQLPERFPELQRFTA